jgi:hypothetical protein
MSTTWQAQDPESRKALPVTQQHAKELDTARDEAVPVLEKEAGRGEIPFAPVKLQPVKSPGIYEAEFGVKDGDLIFHFWPYGYGAAKRGGLAAPRFKGNFEKILKDVMERNFGEKRIKGEYVQEEGSWYVRAIGWGNSQFWYDLSVKACEQLHFALGGE